MGFSLSWVAVMGKSPDVIREELALDRSGQYSECPEAPFSGASLPTGFYLVVADHDERFTNDNALLARLSANAETVSCFVEEHVMFSAACAWANGQQLWSVAHNSEKG